MKRFDPGKKIVDRFDAAAGDRDVVVERWEDDGGETDGTPPGLTDVAWRTILSPVVMVVKVTSVEGRLAEDGNWIESLVTGTITQLLKNATPATLQLNSPVSFLISGGTIKTGTNVLEAINRAGNQRDKPFRENGEYLIFTVQRPGDTLYTHATTSYEIVGRQLRPLRERGATFSIGASADAIITGAAASRNLEAPVRRKKGVK